MSLVALSIRLADAGDAASIAALHAESWRRHYRGAYADRYLDGDLDTERLRVWTDRCNQPDGTITLVAERQGQLLGFVHVRLDEDPTWGALVDNLHVTSARHRTGIGTRLLDSAARMVEEQRPGSGIYLWVLEQNTAAQAFYLARGGSPRGREPCSPPGGDARDLVGTPAKWRIAWEGEAGWDNRSMPTAEQQDALVEQVRRAIASRDVDAFAGLLSEDVRWGSDDHPRRCRSRSDVRAMLARGLAEGAEARMADLSVGANGILCALTLSWPTPDVHPGDRRLFHVYLVRDGQIVEIRRYDDAASAREAAGVEG